jgi:Domain of unknown function (DUF4190)/Uncharacterised protein family UPF0547
MTTGTTISQLPTVDQPLVRQPPAVLPKPNAVGDHPIKTGRQLTLGIKIRSSDDAFYFLANSSGGRRYSRRFPITEEGWQAVWRDFVAGDPEAARLYERTLATQGDSHATQGDSQQQSPSVAEPQADAVVPGSVPGTKVCPMCAEEVKEAAVVCRFCGHQFSGPPIAPSGQAALPALQPPAATPPATSGVAIASFITSLLGLWIAGIPLGIHAQRSIDRSRGRLTGRGFATAGIVLGLLGIAGTIILILLIIHAAHQQPSCTYTYNATGQCVPGT